MDIVNQYLKELSNDNSTNEETLALIELMRNGDGKAKDKLIKNYLLLVVKEARSYINMGVSLADLIAEGNVGLLIALDKYSPEKGVFSSYAKIWIKQSIMRNCMHKKRIVRLPENISELMRSDRWKGSEYREISLDTPNDEGDSLAESIPDLTETDIFASEEEQMIKSKVVKILSFLKERDAEVVKACYGIGRELLEVEEAAEHFNLTTTRINQILRNSLKKMKVSHEDSFEEHKEIEIISAQYGIDSNRINVTDKVSELFMKNENIKVCNKLGGDPCIGVLKNLVVQYIQNDQVQTRTFNEKSIVKF